MFKEIRDPSRILDLFTKEGLEVGNEPVKSNFLKILVYEKEGTVLAAAALARRGESLVLDGIAVDRSLHGKGIGRKILEELLVDLPFDEDLYLVAKEPDFFHRLGFSFIEMKDLPPIFGCNNCDREGVECFPKAMVLPKGSKLK